MDKSRSHSEPLDILPGLAKPGGIEAFGKAKDEYEELLKGYPRHRREYRKRKVKDATQMARHDLERDFGPEKAGRTPSRELQDLGRRAAKLYNQVGSWGKVAHRLCPQKSFPKHKCDKNCADRIRQNAQPYLD